ncbi:MAG: NADPH oxidase activator 1 [Thelocarpon impressellum]|nr:MAG: NADPH oxidase activator 1 [Thelocarpon impressellum]
MPSHMDAFLGPDHDDEIGNAQPDETGPESLMEDFFGLGYWPELDAPLPAAVRQTPLTPENFRALWTEAMTSFYLARWHTTLRIFRELLHRDASAYMPPSRLRFNVALVRVNLGEWALAAEAFDRALADEPGLAIAWAGLGAALFRLADFRRAEKRFRRCLECFPEGAWMINYGDQGLRYCLEREGVEWNVAVCELWKLHMQTHAPKPMASWIVRMPDGLFFWPVDEDVVVEGEDRVPEEAPRAPPAANEAKKPARLRSSSMPTTTTSVWQGLKSVLKRHSPKGRNVVKHRSPREDAPQSRSMPPLMLSHASNPPSMPWRSDVAIQDLPSPGPATPSLSLRQGRRITTFPLTDYSALEESEPESELDPEPEPELVPEPLNPAPTLTARHLSSRQILLRPRSRLISAFQPRGAQASPSVPRVPPCTISPAPSVHAPSSTSPTPSVVVSRRAATLAALNQPRPPRQSVDMTVPLEEVVQLSYPTASAPPEMSSPLARASRPVRRMTSSSIIALGSVPEGPDSDAFLLSSLPAQGQRLWPEGAQDRLRRRVQELGTAEHTSGARRLGLSETSRQAMPGAGADASAAEGRLLQPIVYGSVPDRVELVRDLFPKELAPKTHSPPTPLNDANADQAEAEAGGGEVLLLQPSLHGRIWGTSSASTSRTHAGPALPSKARESRPAAPKRHDRRQRGGGGPLLPPSMYNPASAWGADGAGPELPYTKSEVTRPAVPVMSNTSATWGGRAGRGGEDEGEMIFLQPSVYRHP